ncbi:hypothetical protein GCM10022384_31670 [Streptomyces marokkonensis]|uniref:Uncharacterized protein n=1 Tax=Streptomyces marokkonensis TaxID=324855 RepID=A0ABP7QBX6_9ACTN
MAGTLVPRRVTEGRLRTSPEPALHRGPVESGRREANLRPLPPPGFPPPAIPYRIFVNVPLVVAWRPSVVAVLPESREGLVRQQPPQSTAYGGIPAVPLGAR